MFKDAGRLIDIKIRDKSGKIKVRTALQQLVYQEREGIKNWKRLDQKQTGVLLK